MKTSTTFEEEKSLLNKSIAIGIALAASATMLLWEFILDPYVQTVAANNSNTVVMFTTFVTVIGAIGCVTAVTLVPLLIFVLTSIESQEYGYQTPNTVKSFLPNSSELVGATTKQRVREDTDEAFFGYTPNIRTQKMRDKIETQRTEVPCQVCDSCWSGTSSKDAQSFTYIEEYKQWRCIIPLYTKHIATIGYCPNHVPDKYKSN